MTMVRNIRRGAECELGGMLFVYRPGVIDIYTEAMHVGKIEFDESEVTTTQHFEEKCMWWAHEYNQI